MVVIFNVQRELLYFSGSAAFLEFPNCFIYYYEGNCSEL